MLHEAIDPRTTFFVAAVLYVLLALSAWFAMAGQRSTQVAQWCAAGLIAALGIGLIGARGGVPNLLSYHVGNTLCFMALLIWAQVLRSHLGRAYPPKHIVAAVAGFLLLYNLTYSWAPLQIGQFSRLGLGLLSAHVAWLATLVARRLSTPNGWPIAAAYGLLSAALLTQFASQLLSPVDELSPFSATTGAVMIALAALVTAIVGSFCYVGLVLDEAVKANSDSLAEQARVFETIHLAEQIALINQDSSLQVLSAAISHELAQPLTAALTSAQVAHQRVQMGRLSVETLHVLVDQVDTNMTRAAAILERLDSLRSHSQQSMRCLDLRALLSGRMAVLQQTLCSKDISVVWNLSDGFDTRVHGDALELSQVIDNLLRNAIEAMEDMPRRQLTIGLSGEANRLRLTISDTGKGLDPDTAGQAMQAFFTTKSDGMGIGLSIVRAFTERNGGTLQLDALPDGGASVSVEFPVCDEHLAC